MATKKTSKKKATKKKSSTKKASAKKATAKKASAKKSSAKKAASKKKAPAKRASAAKSSKSKSTSRKSSPPKSSSRASAASGAKPEAKNASAEPAADLDGPQLHEDSELTRKQLELLHAKLLHERRRVREGMDIRLSDAINDMEPLADDVDIAQRHSEQAALMRFADKERKLLLEIEHALEKMDNGDYGVCEGTGEPISFKRLEVRPWTRYSVEYKEQLERERRQHRR